MGRLIIERRISRKTGESAENSVMDLMSIFAFKPIPARIFADSLIHFCVLFYFFSWHGRKLLFERKFAKSRVVGFGKRIFIPDLYQKMMDLGL